MSLWSDCILCGFCVLLVRVCVQSLKLRVWPPATSLSCCDSVGMRVVHTDTGLLSPSSIIWNRGQVSEWVGFNIPINTLYVISETKVHHAPQLWRSPQVWDHTGHASLTIVISRSTGSRSWRGAEYPANAPLAVYIDPIKTEIPWEHVPYPDRFTKRHYIECTYLYLPWKQLLFNVDVVVLLRWQLIQHWPRAGSGVVRMDPLSFRAGCRTRRLNQA